MPCEHCPHCQAETAPDPVAELRQWCLDRGHVVLPGDRVNEATFALMIGRELATVQNWAYQDQPVPFDTIRRRRYYRLVNVAALIK